MSGPDQEGGGDSYLVLVKTKTRKYEKKSFKKKMYRENFNTGISKSRLGCFTF
jgi:hypothetical protein